jgi:predicted amidohydrolase
MKYSAWREKVEGAADSLHTAWLGPESEQPAHVREALATLSDLFLDAPAEVEAAFRDLTEEELGRETIAWIDRFARDMFRLRLGPDVIAATRNAAGYVRALDRDLKQRLPTHHGLHPDPEVAYRTASGRAFVVPRAVTRRGQRPQPFSKRGLLAHRVLPCEVKGLAVRIKRQRTERAALDGAYFGAALFSDFTLHISTTPKHFHLTGLDCPSQETQIRDQVAQAFRANCAVVAWPELMMPPLARDLLAALLDEYGMSHAGPGLVVAGSWHQERADGQTINVGRVFTGAGKIVGEFAKVNPFYLRDETGTRGECIAIGHELLIVLTDFGAVSIGICKDFCDTTFPALHRLDVDLFVVPSMGGESTMVGHQAAGNAAKHASGAGIFVVQQHIGSPPDAPHRPVGWALTSAGLGQSLETLSQNTIFKLYR